MGSEPGEVSASGPAPDPPSRGFASLPRRPDRWPLLGALASGPALLLFGLWLEPDPRGFGTHEQLGLPPCGLRTFFGRPCPACGITTSIVQTLHGHPWLALQTQPFGPLFVSLVLLLWVAALRSLASGEDLRPTLYLWPRWRLWTLLTLFLLAWSWKLSRANPIG